MSAGNRIKPPEAWCVADTQASVEPALVVPDALTITHAHRTLLRRIERGDSTGFQLRGYVGVLVGAGLCARVSDCDDMTACDKRGAVVLTDAGRRLLAAQDETVRRPRPVLVSKPLPDRWSLIESSHNGNTRHYAHTVVRCTIETWGDQVAPLWVGSPSSYSLSVDELLAVARDVVELLEYERHQRAVAAQDGAK